MLFTLSFFMLKNKIAHSSSKNFLATMSVSYTHLDVYKRQAERYAHDIIGNLKSGMNGFIDWNLVLDSKGGPNHAGNFCDAPIMCDIDNNTINERLSYCYIGHFSRFIQKGAHRLLVSSFDSKLESTAFENPDGSIAVIILNTTDNEKTFEIQLGDNGCNIIIEPHSIITALL